MTFFTSDQHLGHRNIIRLCSRPFASIEEMDETLISRWCINKLTLLTQH
jgi:calcineurin-like phosphoesterase family protein